MQAQGGFGLFPRRIGELLDLTYRVYRKGFRVFVPLGIAFALINFAITMAGQALLFSVGGMSEGVMEDPFLLLLASLLSMALTFMLGFVLYATVMVPVASAVEDSLFGRHHSLGSLLARRTRRVVPAMATALLLSVVILMGMMLCVLPGIVAMFVLVLSLPIVVLEHRSGLAAMHRSIDLVLRRGPGGISLESNWVRVLVVGLATVMVLYMLNLLASIPIWVAMAVAGVQGGQPHATVFGPQLLPLWLLLPLWGLAAMIQGIFATLGIIPWPLVYFDIRARNEGLDLEMAALAMEGAESPGGLR